MGFFVELAGNALIGCTSVSGAPSPKKLRKRGFKLCMGRGAIIHLHDHEFIDANCCSTLKIKGLATHCDVAQDISKTDANMTPDTSNTTKRAASG